MSSDDLHASDSEKRAGNQPLTDGIERWKSIFNSSSDSDDEHKDKRHKQNPLCLDSEDEDKEEDKDKEEEEEEDEDEDEDEEEAEKYYMEIAKSCYDISSDYGRELFSGVVKYDPNEEFVLDAAHFAVMEYNTKHVEKLAFEKVLKVNIVLVAGFNFYITLEASKPDGGTGIYETEVLRYYGEPHILVEFRPKALPDH